MIHGIVMFSGGLDSACAAHLLQSQGLSLRLLHFVPPFEAGLDLRFGNVRAAADKLGLELRIVEEGEEYLTVVKDPAFGFGKNANPCLDCRIHRLMKAKKIMEELGASFIATGEVVGQRPMSQRRDCLFKIENRTGLKGRLLRPLSAKLLPPTTVEESGLVDREKLLGISGRGRKDQIAYAQKFGLVHGTPGGGCILTNERTAERFKDLAKNNPGFDLEDFKLLAWGRHFRLSPECKLIIGRDDPENMALEKIASPPDRILCLGDAIPGPLGILRGPVGGETVSKSASLFARYTKFRDETSCRVILKYEGKATIIDAVPANDEECGKFRI